jgi:extracellular factor (EF) 3-hydroxypalmitic acid methyl ester biosynthesis protein
VNARTASADAQRAPEPMLEGRLELAERAFGVRVACAGRLALRVAFLDVEPPDGTVFDRLVLRVDASEITLSSCRFDALARDGFSGRLTFLDDVYDVRALLYEGRPASLGQAARSVPLLLGQRERVRPEFRSFVADAMYDLSVWRRFFDDAERAIADEPPEIADAARQAMIKSQRSELFGYLDRHMADLAALVADYTEEEHERHGFYLRRQAWQFITESAFLARTNMKPRGYAGDAEMMLMIYENRYVGSTVFAKLMHKHPVETAAADAVRNRRHLVTRVLHEVLPNFARAPGPLSVFSVACGPAAELEDIFATREDFERLRCTLLDQDPHALAAARECAARLERVRGAAMRVEWLQDSVRTMLRSPRLGDRLGRHHLVYSMGLFDYLSTPVARAVLERLYDLVLPGGTLLVGNYHVRMPCRIYMEYWADWRLLYRTEGEMLELAAALPHSRASIEMDPSGCQMFLRVERQRS